MAVIESGRFTKEGKPIFIAKPKEDTTFTSRITRDDKGNAATIRQTSSGKLVEVGSAADIVLTARERARQTGSDSLQTQKQVATETILKPGQSRTLTQTITPSIPSQQQDVLNQPEVGRVQTQITQGFEDRTTLKEEIFQTTLRDGAKTTTIFERESFAKTDPSDLSLYGRIDLLAGGRLPGGVTTEFAKSIKAKELILASPEKRRQVAIRDVSKVTIPIITATIIAPASVGGFVALGATGIKSAVAAAPVTIASTAAIIGGGKAVKQIFTNIGSSKYVISDTQREILATKPGAIDRAISAGTTRVKAEGARFSDPGFFSDVSKNKQIFDAEIRISLQKEGFVGGKLDEATALAIQQKKIKGASTVAELLTISAGSEAVGRNIFKATTKKGANAFITTSKATQAIGIAGFGEGVATDLALTSAGIIPKNYARTVGAGFGGAFSAAAIGGKIVKASITGQKGKSKFIETLAFVTDPLEKPGDILAGFGSKLSRARINVPTFTNIFTTSKSKGKARSITPTSTNSITKSITAPTSTAVTSLIRGTTSTRTLTPTNIFNPVTTNTPTTITSTTSVPSTTNINNIINTPTTTNVPITTNIPTQTNVPITVPTFRLPGIPMFGGGSSKKKAAKKKKRKKTSRFLPSAVATAFNIRGKTSKRLTGFEVRKIRI